ncbi:MAG: phenylacetate--CoA ligase [Clostridiales bacterium]|nr:phenylacetate--CoA ligase [Clostridiales bacterium]
MYYSKRIETMSRDELSALQSERLVNCVKRVYENVDTYKRKFDEASIQPGDIKSIEDISRLPFTYKQDLRDNYPFGLFAVPMEQVIRVHASSGTTGKQTVVGYTNNDIDIWSQCMARTFAAGGVSSSDIIHISYGYGLFTGGLGAHYGSEKLGATTVPVSVGNTKRQIQILRDFGCTSICCTPSYIIYIAETLESMGLTKDDISLRRGFLGAEPWTDNMRRSIEDRLGIKAFDIYGLSEIMGPGVAFECDEQHWLHVNEDHFYPEIIDPETLEVLPDNTEGELVFTCMTKEALPLIRYRTRDISKISHENCSCGRIFVRMSKPAGRTDDMLIIRGVNVFPSQIESVLLEIPQVSPYYLIVVDRVGVLDTIEISVEIKEGLFFDEVRAIESLKKQIKNAVESTLGIAAQIKLVPPRTLERSEGKSKHVIDNRAL